MPRFASIVVVEAADAEQAFSFLADATGYVAQTPPWRGKAEATFAGDPLTVAELDEYDTRSLVAAIATHPDLPGGR